MLLQDGSEAAGGFLLKGESRFAVRFLYKLVSLVSLSVSALIELKALFALFSLLVVFSKGVGMAMAAAKDGGIAASM